MDLKPETGFVTGLKLLLSRFLMGGTIATSSWCGMQAVCGAHKPESQTQLLQMADVRDKALAKEEGD